MSPTQKSETLESCDSGASWPGSGSSFTMKLQALELFGSVSSSLMFKVQVVALGGFQIILQLSDSTDISKEIGIEW